MEHCKDLMLENARFMISCMEKKPSSNGIDDIEFLVSMNPGQDFSSLSASASGGELSRLMLALKVVFQATNGIETIIFDEIDTGVSGKVALAMGAKMKAYPKITKFYVLPTWQVLPSMPIRIIWSIKKHLQVKPSQVYKNLIKTKRFKN